MTSNNSYSYPIPLDKPYNYVITGCGHQLLHHLPWTHIEGILSNNFSVFLTHISFVWSNLVWVTRQTEVEAANCHIKQGWISLSLSLIELESPSLGNSCQVGIFQLKLSLAYLLSINFHIAATNMNWLSDSIRYFFLSNKISSLSLWVEKIFNCESCTL